MVRMEIKGRFPFRSVGTTVACLEILVLMASVVPLCVEAIFVLTVVSITYAPYATQSCCCRLFAGSQFGEDERNEKRKGMLQKHIHGHFVEFWVGLRNLLRKVVSVYRKSFRQKYPHQIFVNRLTGPQAMRNSLNTPG